MFQAIVVILLISVKFYCIAEPVCENIPYKHDLETKNVWEKIDFLDLSLKFSIEIEFNEILRTPEREEVIDELYGEKPLFNDELIAKAAEAAKIVGMELVAGSPQRETFWKNLISIVKPKMIVEVGVFKGKNSIFMAEELVRQGLHKSYVVSIDTFLVDQRFPWTKQMKSWYPHIFEIHEIAGG